MMNTVEWRPVVGYESFYEVSSGGEIRRTAKGHGTWPGRVLRPQGSGPLRNYLQVCLSGAGLRTLKKIHVAVLEAFVGPCPEGQECRHLDGDSTNNRLSNLRWGTRSENSLDKIVHGTHHAMSPESMPTTKLDRSRARVVCRLALRGRVSKRRIGEWFGVGREQVHYIGRGKYWEKFTEDIRRGL